MKLLKKFLSLSNTHKGKYTEQLAISYLKTKKFRILAQNYTTKYAEIDIIAKIKNSLVAIEVKSGTLEIDELVEKIDKIKRNKMERAILQYREQYQLTHLSIRFDIIAIQMPQEKIYHFTEEFFDE